LYQSDHLEKRVSFLITTKNRASRLEKTLQDLSEMVTNSDEIVVIDGGSTDGSVDVIRRYSTVIGAWISEPDEGATHAFNKAILLAQGRFLIPYADDDELRMEGVEQAVDILEVNAEIDLLVCGGTKVTSEKSYPIWIPDGTGYGSSVGDPWYYGAPGVGLVIRRSSLAKTGLFESRLASDLEFVSRAIALSASVRFARIHLYTHFITSESHIVGQKSAILADARAAARQYMGLWGYLRWRYIRLLTSKHTYVGRATRFVQRITSGIWRRVMRRPYDASKSFPVSELLDPESRHWDGGFS